MGKKLGILVIGLLLIYGNERCKTFAGANPSPSVWSSIASDEQFSIFRDFLQATGWHEKLADEKETYTVFAPTNAAFTKLGTAMLNEMNSPDKKEQLNVLMQRHIFKGSLDKEALIAAGKTPPSMNGNEYAVRRINNKWYIGNTHPTQNPLFARNGMFYVVDAVIE